MANTYDVLFAAYGALANGNENQTEIVEITRETTIQRVRTMGKLALFLCAGLLAGGAASGGLDPTWQEAQRGGSKLKVEEGTQGKVEGKTQAKALGRKMATGNGTTLKITNNSADPVPVQITLGSGNYGISNINQLPSSWGIIPGASAPTMGIFILAAKSSVSFNSGTNSFSGNVGFGPTFNARGCGSSNSQPNPCYPNSINLAEFTLNMPGETVDISDVNGANASITVNFTGQTSNNQWNDGTFQGANSNVTTINIQPPLSTFANQIGVYGWQATNCINVIPPVPNGPPANLCPAPVNAPSGPQLQTNAQCNIQRGGSAPTGGTVEIVFGGFTDGPSAPQPGCVIVYTINPASGTQSGGTTVTMAGWGLSQVTGVTFQGAQATIVSQSNTQLVVTTPACNFCGGGQPQPWNSNVLLNLANGGSYILPAGAAGPNATAAYVFTSN